MLTGKFKLKKGHIPNSFNKLRSNKKKKDLLKEEFIRKIMGGANREKREKKIATKCSSLVRNKLPLASNELVSV